MGGARYPIALTHVTYVTADQTRDYGVTDAEVDTLKTVEYKTVKAQFWNWRLQTDMHLDILYLLSNKEEPLYLWITIKFFTN